MLILTAQIALQLLDTHPPFLYANINVQFPAELWQQIAYARSGHIQ